MTTYRKWFIRCRGCLSVTAIEVEIPPTVMRCDCQGSIEVMGAVRRQRITNFAAHTPCDLRCTMASGPECNCQCGGENHGSGVTVAVFKDVQGIPRVIPRNQAQSIRVHREWLQARNFAEARVRRFFPDLAGQDSKASRGNFFLEALDRAGALKIHSGRLKAIQKMQDDLTKEFR